MSLAPVPKGRSRSSLFSDSGESTAKLSLIQAVFYDRTRTASEIIKTDPDQINLQDPFAGLTSLHIAIFRQNLAIVEQITAHPVTKIDVKDRFDRRAIDMCIYTASNDIFQLVFERTYRSELLELDVGRDGSVVPFDPGS